MELLKKMFLTFRFNRNIVECKGDRVVIYNAAGQVLIETLWNVKMIRDSKVLRAKVCFNRNIVECKGSYLYIPVNVIWF
ncbi:Uncharacterised protein [uncultured Clostridium sp.]|nr:Uncharacterised protein [uncultured Clostridium sp.]